MESWLAIASPVIAGLALAGWYLERREKQRDRNFRREDVMTWANQAIETLQSVALICLRDEAVFAGSAPERMGDLALKASVLAEQGRIFFKNVPEDGHGVHKPEAYRGRRPAILDPLVLAHEVACAWHESDGPTRRKCGKLLVWEMKVFVTLILPEIGRSKTAPGGASLGGRHLDLASRLAELDQTAAATTATARG